MVTLNSGNLTLPDATVNNSLMTTVLFPFALIEPWPNRSPGIYLTHTIRYALYLFLSLYITISAPCFGSDQKCNMCMGYYQWLPARCARFFAFGVLSAVHLYIVYWSRGPPFFGRAIAALVSQNARKKWVEHDAIGTYDYLHKGRAYRIFILTNPDEPQQFRPRFREWVLTFPQRFFEWFFNDTQLSTVFKAHEEASDQKSWKLALALPRCQKSLLAIVITALNIYATEDLVRSYLDRSSFAWGYGQVAAMVLVAPSVVETFRLICSIVAHTPSKPEDVHGTC